MKLFNEIPSVLPIYTDIRNQNRKKENVRTNCSIPLLSPSDAIIPFLVKIPINSSRPTSWKLYSENGQEVADLTNNINLIKAFNFDDTAFAYYNGQKMNFKFENFDQDLNLNGNFYFVLEIDVQKYFSEVFTMCSEIKHDSFGNNFVKIVFWDEVDVEPLRYRNNFKQILYLNTFIHTSDTEIQEDVEPDGFDNEIPTFQKLMIRQRMSVVVPDFLKTAIETIQLHENIEVFEKNKRSGNVDRFKVNSTSEEFGSMYSLEIVMETDVLMKSSCNDDNKPIVSEIWN